MVYRSDFRYLPYPMHFSEFMPISFSRKQTKHENTQSLPFSYLIKMAAGVNTGMQSINTESLFNIRGKIYVCALETLERGCECCSHTIVSCIQEPRKFSFSSLDVIMSKHSLLKLFSRFWRNLLFKLKEK